MRENLHWSRDNEVEEGEAMCLREHAPVQRLVILVTQSRTLDLCVSVHGEKKWQSYASKQIRHSTEALGVWVAGNL